MKVKTGSDGKEVILLTELEEKREDMIRKCLGMLYNGIIDKKITFRKGNIYFYGGGGTPDLVYVREVILNNIHEVSKKMTSENLDILEFLLDKIELLKRTYLGNEEEILIIDVEKEIKNAQEDIAEIKVRCMNLLMLSVIESGA